MVPKDELTLAILAGGHGHRLGGVDKGSLRCEGRTLLERLMDLETLAAHTLVIGADDDVVKGKGAPGGVVTALCRATTPWVLCVCCDMPHVTAAVVAALRDAASSPTEKDVCAFEVDRALQPFPALYRAALGEVWRSRLSENPSLGVLLKSVRCETLSLDPSDPSRRAVRSVNTPDDARELGVDVPR
jgi:molybdopterin-guanine dinucleotide biosynthesis protein A